ncbi:MAG: type II CAAX endopeptidase family protein [Actinomycetota bacterium]
MSETVRTSRISIPLLVGAFVAGYVAAGLLALVAVQLSGVEDALELPMEWALLAQLGLWGAMLGLPWLVARMNGERLIEVRSLVPSRRDVGLGVLVGAGMQLVVLPIVYTFLFRVDNDEVSEAARELTDRADGVLGIGALILLAAIGAPIVEEVFHRGLLQPRLISRLAVPGGIAVTALLFGASHLQLLQLPGLVLFGLAVGALAHWRGSLGSPIVAHVVFNSIALLTLLAVE